MSFFGQITVIGLIITGSRSATHLLPKHGGKRVYLVEHFRVLQLVSPTPVFTAVSQFGHFTAHRQPGIVIGITALGYRFEIVLPDNSNMIRLLRVVSFPVSRTIAVGEGRVKIQIVPDLPA